MTGSGPNGRIIARDIESAIAMTSDVKHPVTGTPVMSQGEYTDIKISNIRRIIARTMHESLSTSAQLTHHMSADARKITALRARFKTDSEKSGNAGITINDMVCYAVVKALQKHPDINGHFLAESIRMYKKVHLGIAVDTARGLMVPAVQNADDLSLKGFQRVCVKLPTSAAKEMSIPNCCRQHSCFVYRFQSGQLWCGNVYSDYQSATGCHPGSKYHYIPAGRSGQRRFWLHSRDRTVAHL